MYLFMPFVWLWEINNRLDVLLIAWIIFQTKNAQQWMNYTYELMFDLQTHENAFGNQHHLYWLYLFFMTMLLAKRKILL